MPVVNPYNPYGSPLVQGGDPFGGMGMPAPGGGGGGPGSSICWAAGLGANCTWADLAITGVGAAVDYFGGGGSEPESAPDPTVPGNGGCPGMFSVRDPITGRCVDLTALPPGGDPAFTAPVGEAVKGRYGAGLRPGQRTVDRLVCPGGWVLGDDDVCYERLARSRRKWDPGMKPLLTGGDRAAIRKAASAANKLKRARKGIKKASRALDKVC